MNWISFTPEVGADPPQLEIPGLPKVSEKEAKDAVTTALVSVLGLAFGAVALSARRISPRSIEE